MYGLLKGFQPEGSLIGITTTVDVVQQLHAPRMRLLQSRNVHLLHHRQQYTCGITTTVHLVQQLHAPRVHLLYSRKQPTIYVRQRRGTWLGAAAGRSCLPLAYSIHLNDVTMHTVYAFTAVAKCKHGQQYQKTLIITSTVNVVQQQHVWLL